MRTNLVLAVTAIAIASLGAAYYFLPDPPLPSQGETVTPALSSTSRSNEKNTPIREESHTQPTPQEQRQLALMNEKITSLEAKLRNMEALASKHAQDQTASEPDESEANKDIDKTKAKRLLEDDFGQWLDTALVTGEFDRDATRSTVEQMGASLAQVPGITLTDMQCGERFCRASFASDNGDRPDISQLMGASPFIDSGFTLNEPDGRVRVYFTQQGQSLSELRSEAQEQVLGNMYAN